MSTLPTIIVLAAGKSERFKAAGGSENKLNVILNGQRVRDHVMAAVKASGLPWHVVEREHTQHLPTPGMADSIACGVAATADAKGWLILPADLPLIQASTLQAVAQALQSHTVVVPFYLGKQGHPVGFQAACGKALQKLTGDEGARAVVMQHTFLKLSVMDEGVVLDVDTPELLEQARSKMRT